LGTPTTNEHRLLQKFAISHGGRFYAKVPLAGAEHWEDASTRLLDAVRFPGPTPGEILAHRSRRRRENASRASRPG
jgi:hypothetical protein